MSLEPDNTGESDINHLIKTMYDKLVFKRLELMDIRRKGNAELIEKTTQEIADLNEDFDGLIKMQTQYNKFQKSMGISTQSQSKEMQQLIGQIRSNVGSIVSQIPKAPPDVI